MPSAITDLNRAAVLFHALSDPTRLALLDMLKDGERCVCELQDELDAAQSRLSFHLKVLREAGLVIDRKEGRWSETNPPMFYRSSPPRRSYRRRRSDFLRRGRTRPNDSNMGTVFPPSVRRGDHRRQPYCRSP